jgi:hypothetical protein
MKAAFYFAGSILAPDVIIPAEDQLLRHHFKCCTATSSWRSWHPWQCPIGRFRPRIFTQSGDREFSENDEPLCGSANQ